MRTFIVIAALCVACASHAADSFPDAATPEKEPSAEQRKAIDALIVNLGDQQYDVRKAAKEALVSLGPIAVGQLRAAAKESKDAEVRRLATNIIALASDEVWEGFYYYSTESYEQALKKHVRSVHFTLTVTRNANGSFTASADEDGDLGKSSIEGRIDKRSGTVTFDKTYAKDTQLSWHYTGKWNAQTGRVEGTYGQREGGFILFPRRLGEDELKRLK